MRTLFLLMIRMRFLVVVLPFLLRKRRRNVLVSFVLSLRALVEITALQVKKGKAAARGGGAGGGARRAPKKKQPEDVNVQPARPSEFADMVSE